MPFSRPGRPGAVLSTQVSHSRYFFLALGGRRTSGVVPAYGGVEDCNPDYLIERDGFSYFGLELVVAGEGSVRLDSVAEPLRAGSLFVYGPATRVEIRTDPRRPMRKYFLCLSGDGAARRLREAGLRAGVVRRVARFAEVQRVLDDLLREGAHATPTARRLGGALTEVLLLKIGELLGTEGPAGGAGEETFLRCKTAIEANAVRLATLGDITREVKVGPTRLCRLFRRFHGTSPYQYLLQRKMTLAAEHLMDPNARVKEAASAVGFADPYHFSRCFKNVHRVAPRDFQRALQRA